MVLFLCGQTRGWGISALLSGSVSHHSATTVSHRGAIAPSRRLTLALADVAPGAVTQPEPCRGLSALTVLPYGFAPRGALQSRWNTVIFGLTSHTDISSGSTEPALRAAHCAIGSTGNVLSWEQRVAVGHSVLELMVNKGGAVGGHSSSLNSAEHGQRDSSSYLRVLGKGGVRVRVQCVWLCELFVCRT